MLDEPNQLADAAMSFNGVPQLKLPVDAVPVRAPRSLMTQIPSLLELGDDALHRAFGDANFCCDLAHAGVGSPRDAEQYVGVVRQERPAWLGGHLADPSLCLAESHACTYDISSTICIS